MNPISVNSRMTIVDALRGFALAGIVVVHMIENYAGAPIPEAAVSQMNQGLADQIVLGMNELFLRGKFFALFSFLFGLSFFIQMDRAAVHNTYFGGRFLWRLVLLLLLGYLHHLFYRGDILTIYAILGMLLIPFYNIQRTWLLAVSSLLFLGAGRYAIFALTHSTELFIPGLTEPENPIVSSYYDTIKNGSLGSVMRTNAIDGHVMKADFQLGVFGRAYLTFAFFLLGLWAGRLQFFRNFLQYRGQTRKLLWYSLALFAVGVVLMIAIFAFLGPEATLKSWLAMAGLTAYDLANLGMTGILLAGFVLLFTGRTGSFLALFAPYGRMALTNYVFQSLIGTFIFYGWGLGYLAEWSIHQCFLLSLLVVAIQMLLSKWWMHRFHYGPLEWLWRSLTYLKRYPMKR